MEAQESCGRTWQFRILWGDLFVAAMVKIPLFLHEMHPRSFNHLRPCMDHGIYSGMAFTLIDSATSEYDLFFLPSPSSFLCEMILSRKSQRFCGRKPPGDVWLGNQTATL